jgi:hypothetical protein
VLFAAAFQFPQRERGRVGELSSDLASHLARDSFRGFVVVIFDAGQIGLSEAPLLGMTRVAGALLNAWSTVAHPAITSEGTPAQGRPFHTVLQVSGADGLRWMSAIGEARRTRTELAQSPVGDFESLKI